MNNIAFLEGSEYEFAIREKSAPGNEPYYQVCDWCRLPFTDDEWGNRHTPHELGCPNADDTDDDEFVSCDCDLNYHEQCCAACSGETEDICSNN